MEQLPERRTGKQVLTDARQAIETVAEEVAGGKSIPGVSQFAQLLGTPRQDVRVPAHLLGLLPPPGPARAHFMACARDAAIFDMWARARTVYAMDDLMLDELRLTTSQKIPTAVLEGVPHPNPFLLLPRQDLDTEEETYYRRHLSLPVGAFVFGRHDSAQQMCSTHDEVREDFGIMFTGFIDQGDGPIPQTMRCTVPLAGEALTVEDTVQRTIDGFHFNDDLSAEHRDMLQQWLRRYVTQVFNSLLYVSTDQSDIETYHRGASPQNQKKGKKRRRDRPGDINTVVKVGFRLGPQLHAARRRVADLGTVVAPDSAGSRPSGWRHPPRRRQGSWRIFWTGRGRSVPKLKWSAPYWVSLDLLGPGRGPAETVVRPVRSNKKRSAHPPPGHSNYADPGQGPGLRP